MLSDDLPSMTIRELLRTHAMAKERRAALDRFEAALAELLEFSRTVLTMIDALAQASLTLAESMKDQRDIDWLIGGLK